MLETTINAGIPAQLQNASEAVIDNISIIERSKTRYVFFAGDVIEPSIKYRHATRAFGGLLRSDVHCLKHDGNEGMIYRCKITEFKTKMYHQPKAMLNPEELKHSDIWKSGYTLKNGKLGANGWEDLVVKSPYLVYREIYPGDEIGGLLAVKPPLGERGLVELQSLLGKDESAKREAQLFYFPNWLEIQTGKESLPETLKELENHIKGRMREATETANLSKSDIQQVGRDMLRSCTEYRLWGQAYLKSFEDEINAAKVKGLPYSYPEKAEMVLVQLEESRKDDLLHNVNKAFSQVGGTQMSEREYELRQRELDLKERELRLEEERLAMAKGEIKPVQELPKQTDSEPISFEGKVCADVNAKQEPCGAKVSKEIAGFYYCHNHPKI
jgi:hypothetical protein